MKAQNCLGAMYEQGRTAFLKSLVGKREMDKNSRNMVLYKQGLNRLQVFCLRKR